MFGQIYQWMQNLAFYMVMVTAVMHVIPNPDYRRYIRFFTGIVLVIMLASPVFKIMGMGDFWKNLYHSREYQEQVEKMEEAVRSFSEADIGTSYNEILTEGKAGAAEETKPGGSMAVQGTEGAAESAGINAEGSEKIGVEEIRIGR